MSDTPTTTNPDTTGTAASDVQPPVLLKPHASRLPLCLLLGCFAAELLIYFLDYAFNYSQRGDWDAALRGIFKTTNEDGLASWASQTQTMLVAITLWFTVVIQRAKNAPLFRTLGWVVLAMFFTYMTIDDGAKVHERVGSALGRMQEDRGFDYGDLFPSYAWQFFVLPFFAAMGVFMLGFLWFQMRDWTSRILVITALAMFVTAVAIDFVEGLDEEHDWNIFTHIAEHFKLEMYSRINFKVSAYDMVEHFFKSAEECIFEMGANSILWFLFIRNVIRDTGKLHIEFQQD